MQKRGLFLLPIIMAAGLLFAACNSGESSIAGAVAPGGNDTAILGERNRGVSIAIRGCAPRDLAGTYLAVVEVKEDDVVVWTSDQSDDAALFFPEGLFEVRSLTLRDGQSIAVRVKAGTAGKSYNYSVDCRQDEAGPAQAPSGGPKVVVGGGGG